MADPDFVQALDFILNRSDEASIEVLAAAVVRRRRDLSYIGDALNIPDPKALAKGFSSAFNTSVGIGVDQLKNSVREMAIRIIREQAPELNDEQIEELTRAWVPGADDDKRKKLPKEVLASMIDQFVLFSTGQMTQSQDDTLREEMGSWPERYWKAFPPVIRSIITDYIKDRITESEYKSKIGIALEF